LPAPGSASGRGKGSPQKEGPLQSDAGERLIGGPAPAILSGCENLHRSFASRSA
jgi:hypothetical protein